MMVWNYKKSGYRKRKRKNTIVGRAVGNLKAAKSGRDNATQVIPFTIPVVLSGKEYSITYNGAEITANAGVYPLNILDGLERVENFQNLRKMYDSMRIDYIRVKLSVTNSTLSTANASQTFDIYTVWDRTGISKGDILPHYIRSPDGNGNMVEDATRFDGLICALGDKITEYSGVSKLQLNVFQRWKQTRTIKPENTAEKSQWLMLSEMNSWRLPYNGTDLYFPIASENGSSTSVLTQYLNAYLTDDNPGIIAENIKYPFKPTLLIGAFVTQWDSNTNQAIRTPIPNGTKIVLSADVEVVCTMKGLRGSPVVS